MTKIIHTADNHLRHRQYSTTVRGDDFTAAFKQVIDLAMANDVDAILNAGDLLDSRSPSPKSISVLAEAHRKLIQAGIPMLVVEGDHDQEEPHWVDALKEFDPVEDSKGGLVVLNDEIYTIPGTKITVYGQGFIGKTKDKYLTIKDQMPKADILLWHAMVQEFCGFPVEQAIQINELPWDRYRLIALGDIHVRDYRRQNHCLLGYPGSIELVKKDEALDKTVSLITIPDEGDIPDPEFLPIKTRLTKLYRIDTEEDMQQVLAELESVADQHPMVFGRYNDRIPDVLKRIHAKIDPAKSIIRFLPLPSLDIPDAPTLESESSRPVESFLSEFIPSTSKLYAMAESLIKEDAPIVTILTEYTDKRLKEIGEKDLI